MEQNKMVEIAKQNGLVSLPDNSQYTNRCEIKSETSNRLYVIAKNKKTGVWSCSCPGWIIHRKCKHLFTLSQMTKAIDSYEKQELKKIQ